MVRRALIQKVTEVGTLLKTVRKQRVPRLFCILHPVIALAGAV